MPTALQPTLSKECFFGIASQGSADIAGSYTTMTNGVLLPLTAPESVERQFNREVLRMADYQDFAHTNLVRSAGEWWEGDVELALIPGSTAELIECIQTRGSYNQAYFCSMYFETLYVNRRLWDAKIKQARFRFTKGDIVRCTLSIIAMDGDTTADATGSFPASALPFQWKETAVSLETAGGGVSADVAVEDIDVTVDNFVHDGSDGLRITATNAGKMQRLYNLSGIGCEGTFVRDAIDALIWTDFVGTSAVPTPADMTLTLTRGSTLTLTIRNMMYNGFSSPIPGDNASRLQTTTGFTATSSDGSTAPITLS